MSTVLDSLMVNITSIPIPGSIYELQQLIDKYGHPSSRGRYNSMLFHLIAVISIYLMFVMDIGPQFMRNRKPYDLRVIMKYYNYVNIAVNAAIVIVGLFLTRGMYECWWCQETSSPQWLMSLGESYDGPVSDN